MKISVIIPAHNAERFLAEAIESVRAQTLAPIETIVIDDGSTDRTAEIAREFCDVQVDLTENRGAGAARNTGVRRSSGDFLAFLDADDLWERHKLELQADAFARNSSLEAVFGHAIEFSEGRASSPLAAPVPGTMLIARAAFERIGWFDESPAAREGVDWYLRAREKSLRAHMLAEVIYRRRLHGRNRSIVERDLGAYITAIKASLDRRRANAEVERT